MYCDSRIQQGAPGWSIQNAFKISRPQVVPLSLGHWLSPSHLCSVWFWSVVIIFIFYPATLIFSHSVHPFVFHYLCHRDNTLCPWCHVHHVTRAPLCQCRSCLSCHDFKGDDISLLSILRLFICFCCLICFCLQMHLQLVHSWFGLFVSFQSYMRWRRTPECWFSLLHLIC